MTAPLLPALGVVSSVAGGSGVLAEIAPPGGSASGYATAAIIAAIGTAVSAVLAGLVALIQVLRPAPDEDRPKRRRARAKTAAQLRAERARIERELARLEEPEP